jgi:outer membrane usher protein
MIKALRAWGLRTTLVATPVAIVHLCGFASAEARANDPGEFEVAAGAVTRDDSAVNDTPGDAAQHHQMLLLAVVVNDYSTGMIGEFFVDGGRLFANRDELSKLGFQIPATVPVASDGLIALSGLPNFTARIDHAEQMLYVTAGTEWLSPTILGARAAQTNYIVESGLGATLNYDLIATSVDGRRFGTGAFDFRAFSPWGVLSSEQIAFLRPESSELETDGDRVIRLDTGYVYSDPRSLRRYRLGDYISGALPWTRPVRMGGAQVNSDFSMRPDLITFPMPAITGSVAVPSTIDVLVNGSRVLSSQVAPGPFQVPQVPVITGGGTVSTTITDTLGRQVVTDLPFYASSALLAPNLQTYSAEIGFVRRKWGVVSNDYGAAAGAITYRRGLSDTFTIEGHAEQTKDMFMAGVGGVMNVANLAVANLAVAGSTRSGRTGGKISAGIQRMTPKYSLGGSVIYATRGFDDIAAVNGDPISRLQANVNAGVALGRFGSFGIAYTEIRRAHGTTGDGTTLLPDGSLGSSSDVFVIGPRRSRLLSASYSAQIGKLAFYATAFRDFSNDDSTNVLVGVTVPLGRHASANASAQASSGTESAQIDISRNASQPGEWGGRLFASADDVASVQVPSHDTISSRQFGQLTYKSNWGQVFAGVDHVADQTTLQAELRGAVSVIGDAVFASNWIDDSFALVETGGIGGIRVRQDNRDVGRTDSGGRLLVADLRSYELNNLSIEPLDAPLDAEILTTKREVRPYDRSGVVVRFPVRVTQGALLRLTDPAGKAIPVGSSATLRSTGVATPVGYDGETYVVDLQEQNVLLIEKPDGRRCVVNFGYEAVAGQIPAIGPLLCRETGQ